MGIQYIVNEAGEPVAVVVPIKEWRELLDKLHAAGPERNDTESLLSSPAMKERLLAARQSGERISWEEVKGALGL
jgi:antitoxin (DNA-binding transcriptional repressor) of toxin-antitoxin stability system